MHNMCHKGSYSLFVLVLLEDILQLYSIINPRTSGRLEEDTQQVLVLVKY